jgi:serine phosphatase RsbU (regulator of sigma subunit)
MKLSKHKKLVLAVAMVLSVIILIIEVIYINKEYSTFKRHIEEKAVIFDRYNYNHIIEAFFANKTETIKQNYYRNRVGIKDITIISEESHTIQYSFNQDLIGKSIDDKDVTEKYKQIAFDELEDENRYFITKSYDSGLFVHSFTLINPIEGVEEASRLYLVYDVYSSDLKEKWLDLFIFGLVAGLMFLMVLILFLYLLLKKDNSLLNKITIALDEVSKGNLSYKLDIEDNDELRGISDKFNKMNLNLKENFRQIETKHKEIVQYAELLKQKVERRNSDLKKNNSIFNEELRMAQRLQLNLIPDLKNFPRKELRFGSSYHSMDKVGGDIFDVIRVGKNGYGILMADASGHGVPASLLASMAKVSFINHSGWGILPSKVCEMVNKDFYQFIGDLNYFLTAYYGVINLETGYFTYSSAGHMPAILYHAKTGQIEELKSGGNPPLGAYIPLEEYSYGSVYLEPHDRIILYTDGIIESRNRKGVFYGKERLLEYVEKNGGDDMDRFTEGVIKDVNSFCEWCEQRDDRAFLCVEFISKVKPADLKKTEKGDKVS